MRVVAHLIALLITACAAAAATPAAAPAATARAATADPAAKADLLAVQGKWEREEPAGTRAPYRRALKEVKGEEEVVTYYRADGSVWRAHRAQFKLSRTGDVKVFTFSNVQVIDGDGMGTRYTGVTSYIYVATDLQFKEVRGFLPGQEAQAPSVLVWKRAKGPDARVAALPAPDARLQGNWVPYFCEEGGAEQDDRRDYLVKFEGEHFTVIRDGKLMLRGTFTTFAAREPRRIDVLLQADVENPTNAGKTLQGIYAIEGEELRWCTGTIVASQPPTEFATHEGEAFILISMRRAKDNHG